MPGHVPALEVRMRIHDLAGETAAAEALAERIGAAGDTISGDLRREIAVAAALAPRHTILDEIEQPVADRHQGVDIGKLRGAANDLMAALLVDIASDRRG